MAKTTKRKPLMDLVTQTDAARIIGVARQNIAGLYARALLDGERVAGTLFITRASAEAEAERRKSVAKAAA